MNLPTWGDLFVHHCSKAVVRRTLDGRSFNARSNPKMNLYHEDFATRRYNYAASNDKKKCRLVFTKSVLDSVAQNTNRTLVRDGRFIWCKDLAYEGKNNQGYREISFSVDSGKKRFQVSEDKILCIPSKIWVNNNNYFSSPETTFSSFSTVFSYENAMNNMAKNSGLSYESLAKLVENDNPHKIGSLVSPRLGYFYPQLKEGQREKDWLRVDEQHPVGIIVGKASVSDYVGKEFYRVRFADTTYEKVHPVQMEVLSEV